MVPTASLAEKHLGALTAVTAFVLTTVKLLSVAHGDIQTAATVISISGWTSLLSIFLTMLPVAVVAAAAGLVSVLGEAIREGDDLKGLPTATITVCALAFLIGDGRLVLAITFIGVTFIGLGLAGRFLLKRKHPQRRLSRRFYFFIAAITALLVAVGSPRPWLPREQVVAAGRDPITGYVLGTEGVMTAVLIDSDRSVMWIRLGDGSSRSTCVEDSNHRPLIAQLIWRDSPAAVDC